ncbi:hypothetical protein GJ496_009021 [Pomphorhynchus laevis]|nr:hypothetical protein GJ496_009021 [Pomphorhynchus laevis]
MPFVVFFAFGKLVKFGFPAATVIVQSGSLSVGQHIVADQTRARVRSICTDDGIACKSASLSEPVVVFGWKSSPPAGVTFLQVSDERVAKKIVEQKLQIAKEAKITNSMHTIEMQRAAERIAYRKLLEYKRKSGMIFRKQRSGPNQIAIQNENRPVLNILLKADSDGSIEAILDVLGTYPENAKVGLNVINFGIGNVTQSDIQNTADSKGVLYCFNVSLPSQLESLQKSIDCQIKCHRIIYHLINDIKTEINFRAPYEDFEEIIGKALVKQVFKLKDKKNKTFTVAGCLCNEGQLKRSDLFHVIRNETTIHTSTASSMKHHKDDVSIIENGMECGISLRDDTVDLEPGDILTCFKLVAKQDKIIWIHNF